MLKVTTMAVSAGLLAASASNAQSQAPIKVGAVLSLSGPAAVFGLPDRDAIEAVIREIHLTAGRDGHKVNRRLHGAHTQPHPALPGLMHGTRHGTLARGAPTTSS